MRIKLFAASIFSALTLTMAPLAHAATSSIITVRPSSPQGWIFNGDPRNTTSYEFNNDQHSIGAGSLYVLPIGTNAADKFTADMNIATKVSNLDSFSYDFQLGSGATPNDANKIYLNLYANIDNSSKYYDCRYDYAATTGSTNSFTTASFTVESAPVAVSQSRTARTTCPAKLSDMPSGSYVRAMTLNVGDTSASDYGLAAYLDKVVVTTTTSSVTYDFEADLTYPKAKDECKKGGWNTFTGVDFKNQGQCVSYLTSNKSDNRDMSNNPQF